MEARPHAKWGPNFSNYIDVHDKRLKEAYKDYMSSREITSVMHDGLLPLTTLETLLIVGERMHEIGYQHGNSSFTVLMRTMRQYVKLNKVGIFEHYYGYLLIRHIMRTVCIGILIEANVLGRFLNDLDPNLDPVEASSALADVALDLLGQALATKDAAQVGESLGLRPPTYDGFQCVGGLSFDDADFLIITIWENRRRLIPLTELGLLPGFPALLFTLCQLTRFAQKPERDKKWTQLQDVMFRSYLVGIPDEQEIMRHLCLTIDQIIEKLNLVGNASTDDEDARMLVKTYIKMYDSIWIGEDDLASIVRLDVASIIFRFVYSFVTSTRLVDCIAGFAQTSLKRIWLEIDQERDKETPVKERGGIRIYSADVFYYIGQLWDRVPPQYERDFSWIFWELDATALLGRVVLMITREEGNNPEFWENFRKDSQGGLRHAMGGPAHRATELEHSSSSDWIKVQITSVKDAAK
ncbi:hypothetical protein RhiJN_03849 [Ceratobasidium sp. AG-Ba]|nr:hypothetical protein RhiJN_03849 [Ceratobasidium sp. AG-Ba]